MAMLSSFFGLLAVLMASIGLYGVMSHSVVRQTALVNDRRDVLSLVLRETMLLIAVGVAIGLPVAVVVSMRLVRDQLFDWKPQFH